MLGLLLKLPIHYHHVKVHSRRRLSALPPPALFDPPGDDFFGKWYLHPTSGSYFVQDWWCKKYRFDDGSFRGVKEKCWMMLNAIVMITLLIWKTWWNTPKQSGRKWCARMFYHPQGRISHSYRASPCLFVHVSCWTSSIKRLTHKVLVHMSCFIPIRVGDTNPQFALQYLAISQDYADPIVCWLSSSIGEISFPQLISKILGFVQPELLSISPVCSWFMSLFQLVKCQSNPTSMIPQHSICSQFWGRSLEIKSSTICLRKKWSPTLPRAAAQARPPRPAPDGNPCPKKLICMVEKACTNGPYNLGALTASDLGYCWNTNRSQSIWTFNVRRSSLVTEPVSPTFLWEHDSGTKILQRSTELWRISQNLLSCDVTWQTNMTPIAI